MERKKVDASKWGNKGVKCPRCECRDSKVEATRNGSQQIQRVRVCRACGLKWSTTERNSA